MPRIGDLHRGRTLHGAAPPAPARWGTPRPPGAGAPGGTRSASAAAGAARPGWSGRNVGQGSSQRQRAQHVALEEAVLAADLGDLLARHTVTSPFTASSQDDGGSKRGIGAGARNAAIPQIAALLVVVPANRPKHARFAAGCGASDPASSGFSERRPVPSRLVPSRRCRSWSPASPATWAPRSSRACSATATRSAASRARPRAWRAAAARRRRRGRRDHRRGPARRRSTASTSPTTSSTPWSGRPPAVPDAPSARPPSRSPPRRRAAGVRRVVYLGGLVPAGRAALAPPRARASPSRSSLLAAVPGVASPCAPRSSSAPARARSASSCGSSSACPCSRCPAWRDHRTAPIDGRDMLEFLARAATAPAELAGRSWDIGGPGRDDLRADDRRGSPTPCSSPARRCRVDVTLTPVASVVGAAIAGEDPALIEPLMESLEHDLLPRDDGRGRGLRRPPARLRRRGGARAARLGARRGARRAMTARDRLDRDRRPAPGDLGRDHGPPALRRLGDHPPQARPGRRRRAARGLPRGADARACTTPTSRSSGSSRSARSRATRSGRAAAPPARAP